MIPIVLALLVLLLPLATVSAGVAGEGVDKSLTAQRASSPPVIDGELTDAIWQDIPTDDRFTQHFPVDGVAPNQRTTLQVSFDARHLYVAINALDSEPDAISRQVARRDSRNISDQVEIFLDTRHDHDSGYWFSINSAGVLADGEIHDDNRVNFDWDAVWTGEALIHGSGWSAELAIPLSILRFPGADAPLFGFNLKRTVQRTGEISHWAHIPRSTSGTMSRAGHITGLDGLAPVRTIELRPFGVVRLETDLLEGGSFALGDAQSSAELSVGMDAKVGLSEGLTLDAAINPDFGQVEADPVVLNLSSFETFFPEKRPFFLEGAGLLVTDIDLIHSRRIGQRTTSFRQGSTIVLPDNSSAQVTKAPLSVPIYAAARVSGSVGTRLSLNALSAVTGPETVIVGTGFDGQTLEVAPPRNYNAVRGKYSLGGSSYLGFANTAALRLGTSIDPEANHDAFAESVDGRWVRRDGMYRLYFQVASSQRSGGDAYQEGDRFCQSGDENNSACRPITRADGTIQNPGDIGSAGEFGGAKASGTMRLYTRYRFVSPTFDVDDMGFENDWDYHEHVANAAFYRETPFLGLQRADVALNSVTQYSFDGTRKALSFSSNVGLMTHGFWTSGLTIEYKPPGSYSTRETSDGARFASSDLVRADLDIASDSRMRLSGGFGTEQAFSPGTELRISNAYAYASLRPTPPVELNLESSVGLTRGDLRVIACQAEEGACWQRSMLRDYTLALQDSQVLNLTARASFAISTELSLEGYLQVFAAGGELHDYRAIYGLMGTRPTILRGQTEELPFDGDTDGDGDRDDRFSFATINANIVLRWELFPGNTLIAVYTRAQRHDREENRLAYTGLRQGPAEEIVLLKFTLFQGL